MMTCEQLDLTAAAMRLAYSRKPKQPPTASDLRQLDATRPYGYDLLIAGGWTDLGGGCWRKDGHEFPRHFALWLERHSVHPKWWPA